MRSAFSLLRAAFFSAFDIFLAGSLHQDSSVFLLAYQVAISSSHALYLFVSSAAGKDSNH